MNVVAMTTNRNLSFENELMVFKLQGVKFIFKLQCNSRNIFKKMKKLR